MKHIWRKGWTVGVIVVTAAVSLLYYPLGVIPILPQKSEIGNVSLFGTGDITETAIVEQQFSASGDYLDSIGIYLQYLSQERTGNLCFSLYDGSGQLVFDAEYPMEGIPNYEWWDMEIEQSLERGETYTYKISAEGYGEKPPQLFAAAKGDAVPESGEYRYQNQTVDAALGLNYAYRINADSFRQVLPFWCFHLLLGGIALEIIWNVKKGGQKHGQA